MTMEIYTCVALSTAHLTQQDWVLAVTVRDRRHSRTYSTLKEAIKQKEKIYGIFN